MFKYGVASIDGIPDSIIKEVSYQYSLPKDITLFATMMMLLYNRVNNLKISYITRHDEFVDCDGLYNPDEYLIYWIDYTNKAPEEYIPDKNKFKRIEKLPLQEKFLSEQLGSKIEFRVMPEENTVFIFTESVNDMCAWHAVQFIIPKFFDVFKTNPLTQEERSFLMTLTQKRDDAYKKAITELARQSSFKRFVLSHRLVGFGKKMYTKKIEAAKSELENLEEAMKRYMDEYSKACTARLNALAVVCGLETMADQQKDSEEVKEYLMDNPHVADVDIEDSDIKFIVKTELAPYAAEEWDVISSHKEYFTKFKTSKYSASDVKLLLDSFLSENRCIKLKMCAYFSMNYFGSNVESAYHKDFLQVDACYKDYIPNPHLDLHNCFGQNKTVIVERLAEGDLISAIECCISCAQKVNIHEQGSFDPFVEKILRSEGRCFVSENGTEMTVEEALKYLKEKKNECN